MLIQVVDVGKHSECRALVGLELKVRSFVGWELSAPVVSLYHLKHAPLQSIGDPLGVEQPGGRSVECVRVSDCVRPKVHARRRDHDVSSSVIDPLLFWLKLESRA